MVGTFLLFVRLSTAPCLAHSTMHPNKQNTRIKFAFDGGENLRRICDVQTAGKHLGLIEIAELTLPSG